MPGFPRFFWIRYRIALVLNAIKVLIKPAFVMSTVLFVGCRTYSVTKAPDGTITVDVSVTGSDTKIGKIEYVRDGEDAYFSVTDFGAEVTAYETINKMIDKIPNR